MRGVGDDDLPTLLVLASICEVGAHQHQAGELALGAGRRLQGNGVEPGDLGEHLLELPAKAQRALRSLRFLMGVQVAEAG